MHLGHAIRGAQPHHGCAMSALHGCAMSLGWRSTSVSLATIPAGDVVVKMSYQEIANTAAHSLDCDCCSGRHGIGIEKQRSSCSTGAVLPVWKELTDIVLSKEERKQNGKPRVLRVSLDNGTRLTGMWLLGQNMSGAI